MILEIIKHPDPILYTPTEAVSIPELKSGSFQTLIENMIDTCINAEGLALAANQVGVDKSLFVYRKPGTTTFRVMVNPSIIGKKGKLFNKVEACLSMPDESFEVKRYKKIQVSALDRDGLEINIWTKSKKIAQCLQHEIDHLNGITLATK
jgi:peptide deformylase